MTKTTQNIVMFAGETKSILVTVYDGDNGGRKNITGSAIHWVMYNAGSSGVLLSKTVGSDITITDGANGEFTIAVSPADTTALTPENYNHEAKVTDTSGNVSVVTTGDFILLESRA